MANVIRIGIAGAGWPGMAHARGCSEAGGFKIAAVADLIPQRRKQLMSKFSVEREYATAEQLLADKSLDAVSICLPNHLHAPVSIAALRSGKHLICETPPALDAKEAHKMASAASNKEKILLYGFQRRFGGPEQATHQAIAKGYAGDVYHARAAWTRTRGIPLGTGWFTDKSRSGGGALIDLGAHVLDIAWYLLGQPTPLSAYAVVHSRFNGGAVKNGGHDVEDSAFALIRFTGGKSLELAASWALNQPPQQQGVVCRLHGDKGAVDVYTAHGAVLHRQFSAKGESKPAPLKPPRLVGHAAMMRHFRACITGKSRPLPGSSEGTALMQMIDALYRSADSGRSVAIAATSSTRQAVTPAATVPEPAFAD